MCGIIGYVGKRPAQPILIDGLHRLEYRGYDSAGIAVVDSVRKKLNLCKTKGTIDMLKNIMGTFDGTAGIGHTRWATCGAPLKNNAHPFLDCTKRIALAHNGIIENYALLKNQLMKEGHVFTSGTDTEVVVHLIEKYYHGDLAPAVRTALKYVRGSYAIAVIDINEKIVAARHESPLKVGIGKNENFVASDIPALLPFTRKILDILDGELVIVTGNSVQIEQLSSPVKVVRSPENIDWSIESAEKGGYKHFMLKEIFEIPTALHNTLLGRTEGLELRITLNHGYDLLKTVGCGTSYHAGLVGKYIFEEIAQLPVSVELASEYRYASKYLAIPLVIAITQSGETADTIAAVRIANQRGSSTIAITNVVGSSITKEATDVIYTRAGPEIGVAASKTFVAQLAVLYLLGIQMGLERGVLSVARASSLRAEVAGLARSVQEVLDNSTQIQKIAKKIASAKDMFFIGRNISYPVALEGALKMKEISYVHAEGYPAGELKHGPLALITKSTPVVAIAIKDHTYEKVIGNINEITARNAPVIGIGYQSDYDLKNYTDYFLPVPDVSNIFSPIPISVALQLLAYWVARIRGRPIDKPRHLAKSVTVE